MDNAELSRHLIRPRSGPNVCIECFNTTEGFSRCFACTMSRRVLDAVVPISYSVAHEPLHQALWRYKRAHGLPAQRATIQLASILSQFLERHEVCVAARVGERRFSYVTTVPSGDRRRDEDHPLRRIVGELCRATRPRHERLLLRTPTASTPRTFDPGRYAALRDLTGASVLLIDDTWTTGASAQSAAAALKAAGAVHVAAVVIGRHVNRDWHANDQRLRALQGSFDLESCVLCGERVDSALRDAVA